MPYHPITLPSWLSKGMVFQQNTRLPLHGRTLPRAPIKLEVVKDPTDGRKVSKLDTDYGIIWTQQTHADEKGGFVFLLPAYRATIDTYTFIFSTPDDVVSVKDLRCGDVWLFLGGAELCRPIAKTGAPKTPLKPSILRLIRMFLPPRIQVDAKHLSSEPLEDIEGDAKWISVHDKQLLSHVSSAGLSLAYHLADQLNYPVGIIDLANMDSATIDWVSKARIDADEKLADCLKALRRYKQVPIDSKDDRSLDFPLDPSSEEKNENSSKSVMSSMYNLKMHPLKGYNIRGIVFAPDVSDADYKDKYEQLLLAMLKDVADIFGPAAVTDDKLIPSLLILQVKPCYLDPSDRYSVVHFNENLLAIRRRLRMPVGILPQHDMLLPEKTTSFWLGKRMAQIAMGIHVTPKMPRSAPECIDAEFLGNKVMLTFDHTADGLRLGEGEQVLRGFAVCGEDRIYRPAKASILHGIRVMVWHDDIKTPAGVAYGYYPIPHMARLKNRSDLPAVLFRLDRNKAVHYPDLTFTHCERLTQVGLEDTISEFDMLPIYRVMKGEGQLATETLNKTEGAASLKIVYLTEEGCFSFGPILRYASLYAPLDLPSCQTIAIDFFNPDPIEKTVAVKGYGTRQTLEQKLAWQTLRFSLKPDQKLMLDHFEICIYDRQKSGGIYVDNIRFQY